MNLRSFGTNYAYYYRRTTPQTNSNRCSETISAYHLTTFSGINYILGVNILTLTLAIATSVLILNYVVFEKSYDSMHTLSDRIYRVESQFYEGRRSH